MLVSVPQPVTYGSPPEEELLELDELDEELLDEDELLVLDDEELLLELDDEELDELLELLTSGPMEHQAEVVKLFAGNADSAQLKLPVRLAYTKLPALPSATLWVPVMLHVPPTCAHFV